MTELLVVGCSSQVSLLRARKPFAAALIHSCVSVAASLLRQSPWGHVPEWKLPRLPVLPHPLFPVPWVPVLLDTGQSISEASQVPSIRTKQCMDTSHQLLLWGSFPRLPEQNTHLTGAGGQKPPVKVSRGHTPSPKAREGSFLPLPASGAPGVPGSWPCPSCLHLCGHVAPSFAVPLFSYGDTSH